MTRVFNTPLVPVVNQLFALESIINVSIIDEAMALGQVEWAGRLKYPGPRVDY